MLAFLVILRKALPLIAGGGVSFLKSGTDGLELVTGGAGGVLLFRGDYDVLLHFVPSFRALALVFLSEYMLLQCNHKVNREFKIF